MHVAKDSSVGVDNGPVKQIKGRNQPTIRISEYEGGASINIYIILYT